MPEVNPAIPAIPATPAAATPAAAAHVAASRPVAAGGSDRARRPERARRPARPLLRLAIAAAIAAIVVACFLLLLIRGNPAYALQVRGTMLGAMIVAAFAQGVGTVIFHTVTQNRILSPAIIGFDSMYTLMQTLLVFFFGGAAIAATAGLPRLLAQVGLMVLGATLLYGWLLGGSRDRGTSSGGGIGGASSRGGLHVLLLVGVVIGLAFSSLSTFLQRVLDPTDYDLLSVQLYGRISRVNAEYLPIAFAVCAAVGLVLWLRRYRLDVLLLGRDHATAVGVDHRRELLLMLMLIAVLIAFSTALIGPMTFFGFVVATLAYPLAGTHQHRFVMPMAFLIGVIALAGGQFIMNNIFYAGGFLTVIIEFVGGLFFLVLLLVRGKL